MKKVLTTERTQTIAGICRHLGEDYMGAFERFPIEEIRRMCLMRLGNRQIEDEVIDWAEKRITVLLQDNDSFAESLLSWYLFEHKMAWNNSRDEDAYEKYVLRALEFVIGLEDKVQNFPLSKISKYVAGVMLKDSGPIHLYGKMPFLKTFISRSLEELMPKNLEIGIGYYKEASWNIAKRSLEILVAAKDFTYLSFIIKLHGFMKSCGMLPHSEFRKYYTHETHLAMMQATINELTDAAGEKYL